VHVFLDVSRLLLCVLRPSPAGIDRVELAYARRWMARPDHSTFVIRNPWGGLAAVPHERVRRLIGQISGFWAAGTLAAGGRREARTTAVATLAATVAGTGRLALRRRLAEIRRQGDRGLYLLVSHLGLENPAPVAALRRQGIGFVPMVHDLIPTTHPEYARPQQVGRHRRRIETAATLADGVIVNSAATAEALLAHLPQGGRGVPPIAVARLELEPREPAPPATPSAQPYFVTLGTIEPRKNHLLLLNLWRDLATRMGRDAPLLLVIGRRGWENENILDMLDRCTGLAGLVRETGPLPDTEVTRLLAGARALLFPSFAEGYGLPLAEALALGTPAICSDLPALREVGGAVPEFLDPLDGAAWREAVLHYAKAEAPRRLAQLKRLNHWHAPSWDEHFAQVDRLLTRLVVQGTEKARSVVPGLGETFPWAGSVLQSPLAPLRPEANAALAVTVPAAPQG
jgi:glycosyltransferase involved in cell wall biosynthesis